MKNQPETKTYPIARWLLKPIPELGFILLRADYLASPMQRQDQPSLGLHHTLSITQAEILVQDLTAALQTLKTAELWKGHPTPKH